ncbi:hypothetical protein Bca4012_004819 [Brassica carinata]
MKNADNKEGEKYKVFDTTKWSESKTKHALIPLIGCVPKKLLVYASKYTHEFEDSHSFGWKYDTEPSHDWSTLIANKNAELQRLTAIYKCP